MAVSHECWRGALSMPYASFLDAREIGADVATDLCIVGAGAAGITIARQFAGTKVRVCLLEAGGLSIDPAVNALSAIESVGHKYPYADANQMRLRYFGGTTNHWGGHCSPLEPDDFEKQDWIPHSGWPYKYEILRPFYVRAHEVLGLGEFSYDADAIGAELGFTTFPFDKQRVVTTVSRYNPVRFGLKFGEELNDARNVKVILHADVSELWLENANSDRIDGVLVKSTAGNAFQVKAKLFVVASGGIENARILLMSNRQRPAGIGNHSDLVGRYFQEHLYYPSGYILARGGGLALKYYLDQWAYGDIRVRGHIALPAETVRELQIPKFRSEIHPVSDAFLHAQHLREKGVSASDVLALVGDPLGVGAVARCRGQAAPTAYHLANYVQQTPNADSRVRLSDKKDELGRPHPQLDWRLSRLDQEGVVKAQLLIAQEVGRSAFGRMRIELDEANDELLRNSNGGAHHIGTTRMDDDPARGVTDGNAKVHHTRNLYMAGSSLFPTCGWPNPTLTIVATSLRLADHLRSRLRAIGAT